MKTIFPILALTLLTPALHAGEKDVWYNAKGKAVKVTPVQKEKEAFVPNWKKRELAREADRAARNANRVRSSGNRYHYVYPSYGSYGYGGYYGGYCGGYNYSRFGGYSHRSRWGFSGTYHGNGWSVRLNY